MCNYFVEAVEHDDSTVWRVCQRPKWESKPVVVAAKSLKSSAEELALELNGLNGGFFTHQPHEKAFSVGCVQLTPYGGWIPIWKGLTRGEAETLVIGLNNGEVFNHFSCELKYLGKFAKRAEELKPRIKVFPTHAEAAILPCSDCNIDLEAGTLVPFAECGTCTKDAPETTNKTVEDHEVETCCAEHNTFADGFFMPRVFPEPRCNYCGKLLGEGEGTHYERGLLCDACPDKTVTAYIAKCDGSYNLITPSFEEVCTMIVRVHGDDPVCSVTITSDTFSVGEIYTLPEYKGFDHGNKTYPL
ncbi:hypothetical protein [Halodesulfovibrio aestuarii]|uniref:Uncharacterized protein n=1 Tax=Halodesulfovibrio aestuarii TaxID=126333 RepID=A0ABV4JWU2_9BACT